jgi:hypothetical protein
MTDYWIWVKPDQDHYAGGDEFSCTVHWNLKELPDQIDISIFWSTRINIDSTGLLSKIGLPQEFEGASNDVQLKSIQSDKASGSEQVQFALPYGPYSFRGKYLTIVWRVKVEAKGSDLGSLDFYVSEFVISPAAG